MGGISPPVFNVTNAINAANAINGYDKEIRRM